MKKIILLAVLSVLLILAVTVMVTAGNDGVTVDHDSVKIDVGDDVGVLTEGGVKFRVSYYLSESTVELLELVEDVRVFAVIADYSSVTEVKSDSGISVDLVKGDCLGTNGNYYYEYTLMFGGITTDKVDSPIAIRGFISYTYDGEEYLVASEFDAERDVFVPNEKVYSAYCNKTYDRGSDVNTLRVFLASNLSVLIEDGKARDALSSEKYESLYEIDYFDGVLTVSLKGGDIPDWLISSLKINGEARYFEIYNGKIKLVV